MSIQLDDEIIHINNVKEDISDITKEVINNISSPKDEQIDQLQNTETFKNKTVERRTRTRAIVSNASANNGNNKKSTKNFTASTLRAGYIKNSSKKEEEKLEPSTPELDNDLIDSSMEWKKVTEKTIQDEVDEGKLKFIFTNKLKVIET